MAVNMAAAERRKLGESFGVAGEHARKIHELSKADHLGMSPQRQQIGGRSVGT